MQMKDEISQWAMAIVWAFCSVHKHVYAFSLFWLGNDLPCGLWSPLARCRVIRYSSSRLHQQQNGGIEIQNNNK